MHYFLIKQHARSLSTYRINLACNTIDERSVLAIVGEQNFGNLFELRMQLVSGDR